MPVAENNVSAEAALLSTTDHLMETLLIYTPQTTNRIRYIFDLFFKEQLGIDYRLTNHTDELKLYDGPKFAYDSKPVANILSFGAVYLLFEKGIHNQEIHITEHDHLKIFYQVEHDDFCLPFDPFAASFYLVSRYEEYFPHATDKHGRFMPENSVAWKYGFLQVPVVNYYIQLVKTCLIKAFPEVRFEQRKFKYIPTFDVDSAYNYLNKGFIRNLGGLVKDLLKWDIPEVKQRIKVVLKLKKDPFDTYDWIIDLHKVKGGSPVFFFLVGDYAEYDKNISVSIQEYQELIKAIADKAIVGIHPSYASNEDVSIVKMEIKRLSKILKRDIMKSRQHFLKLEFPRTYANLIDNDIFQDYTLGYASQLGYRASICSSFNFYSIDQENRTNLKLYPFAVMDATMQYYQKLSPDEAIEAMRPLIEEARNFNGLFVSLWHNNSLSEEKEWKGWRRVYEEMLEMVNG
jgi:hypothetical protein